ncbi:hypothetical protein [Dyella sp. 2RAB6]|uniref:hypothetical protein n=1 Tax=Dyella sp. 2RAB6 TaxID=3232992 RepID=UPI003F9356BC
MTDDTAKPPTQSVGVQGFEALSATPSPNWPALAAYPPFQAFVEELEPNLQAINSAQYAMERGRAAYGAKGEEFLREYVAWWERKGHWRGEDPLGRR